MRWTATVLLAAALAFGAGAGAVSAAKPDDMPKHHKRAAFVMAAPSHQAMYMQLLAEKYAPETKDEWKKTMAERVKLMNEMKELKKSGKWKRDDAKQRMEKMAKERGPEMKAHLELVKQFTKAVEKEDAGEIKAVLPKLLESEKKMNEALRKLIDEQKK